MNRIAARISAILLLIVTGCATPQLGELFSDAPSPPNNHALVYVYRVHSPPYLRTPALYVDGIKAVGIADRGYSWLNIRGGEHDFEVRWPWDLKALNIKKTVTLQAGKTHYFFLAGDFALEGLTTITSSGFGEVSEEEARDAIKQCRFVKPLVHEIDKEGTLP